MVDVRCVQQANAILGEGPSWSCVDGVLYWVDIKRPAVFRFDPALDQTGHWPMPRPVGWFNDGKVDRNGRLWAGTIDDKCIDPTGSLYRFDPDGSIHRMARGFICSNGLGWSPDNRTMYFTDSIVRKIWAYEFDSKKGEIGERRIFATFSDSDGVPDGLTVDAEGFIWVAI